MATRSTIAIEFHDGTIEEIYCHWDGYLENNGKILMEHYKNVDKIITMMNHGDLSSLGTDNASCVYYGRDRGEPVGEVACNSYIDFADYLKNHDSQEYDYIFRNNEWFVKFPGGEFVPVSQALESVEASE